jgi:hypothetical protein
MKPYLLFFVAAALGCEVAQAQLALPGAAGTTPAEAPAKPAHAKKAHRPSSGKLSPLAAPGAESIVGQPLLQNGVAGRLLFSSGDKTLRIDKFTLPGEVVSDPKQKCRIDIVSETPIEAKSEGTPDGLERYSADIPACPLTFDVLDGSVLVPAQTNACVFQAADCQASPSGLWGPDGSSLEKDAKAIAKARRRADASITQTLRFIREHDKGASSAGLTRDQTDFASQRDELCRDYASEARHGFCAARITEARAALLRKRAEELLHKGADTSN